MSLRVLLAVLALAAVAFAMSPTQRFGHSATLINGTIMVIFGGYDYSKVDYNKQKIDTLFNDMWMYDFDTSPKNVTTWVQVLYNSTSPVPKARMLHAASYRVDGTQGKLIISGGTPLNKYMGDRTTLYYACAANDMWEFDFTTRIWNMTYPPSADDLSPCLKSSAGRISSKAVLSLGVFAALFAAVL